jgi:hypothetical protein
VSQTETIAPIAKAQAVTRRMPSTSGQRSKVTNGKSMFVNGDGNSAWTRRFKDLVANHADDIGGYELLSEAQVSLIRRCATLEIELEDMEGQLSKGEEVNLDLYGRIAGHLRRYLETLGVRRCVLDRTPQNIRERLLVTKKDAVDVG